MHRVGSPQVLPFAGRYGGAIWVNTSNVTIANCLIRNSQAHDGSYGAGGAIYASGGSVVIENNEIRDCAAAQGGAVYLRRVRRDLYRITSDNDLLYSAQPVRRRIYVKSCSSSVSRGTIHLNAADPPTSSNMKGGGIHIGTTAGATMNGDAVTNNEGGDGGLRSVRRRDLHRGSGLTMTGVTVQGNQSR
jgi:hypothetical protein